MANNKQLPPFVLAHVGEVCSSIGTTSQDIDEQRMYPDRNGEADAAANRIAFLTPLMEQQLRYLQGILAILYPDTVTKGRPNEGEQNE
jgi:hypothetical protein